MNFKVLYIRTEKAIIYTVLLQLLSYVAFRVEGRYELRQVVNIG